MNLRRALLLCAVSLSVLGGAAACSKRSTAPSDPGAAPSASVISIGVALGTCEDVGACEKECADGSADRCRRLAASYATGQGVEKDEARATALYEKACAMKDAPACVFAGQMHEYAHGVPKDAAKAAGLYERACDDGWPAGCYNYAIMLEAGRGVPADRAHAAALYQRVCDAGAKTACVKSEELGRDAGS
ncbi:MAG TPA: tetratricopeptide repeat protein [Polyangiaceae bacterium]|nr:tetratricopeptide repeat protein [Polyangiaceae bacterium]